MLIYVTNVRGKCSRRQTTIIRNGAALGPIHEKMHTRCLQCRKEFRWTLTKCPRCLFPNEKRPAMVFLKVAAVVIICAAIWLTVHCLVTNGNQDAGVVNPLRDKESLLKRIFSTPEPTPQPDPKFSR